VHRTAIPCGAPWPSTPTSTTAFLRQRIRPVVNQYEFFLPDGDGARAADLLRRAEALQVEGGHPLLRRRVQDAGPAHQGPPALRPARPLRRRTPLGRRSARSRRPSAPASCARPTRSSTPTARRPRALARGTWSSPSSAGSSASSRTSTPCPTGCRSPTTSSSAAARRSWDPQPPGLQAPRHLHDRHVGRPSADDRPPHDPGHRRGHERAAGALTPAPWGS
jgi:hypothetical protein